MNPIEYLVWSFQTDPSNSIGGSALIALCIWLLLYLKPNGRYSPPQRSYTQDELSQETAWARAEADRVEAEIKLKVAVQELKEASEWLAKRKR